MRSRFVVVVDESTPEDQEAITDAVKAEEGVGWWHWFPQTWLIVDVKGRDAIWWRDKLRLAAPNAHFLVVKATGGVWAAAGTKKALQWLHEQW